MINIQIDVDIDSIKAKLGEMPKNIAYKVRHRAINRTLDHTRTNIATEVNLRYRIQKKTVRNSLTVKRPTTKNHFGAIISKGSPIPLTNFDVSPRRPVNRLLVRKKGTYYDPSSYKARVLKGGQLKSVERMFYVKGQLLQRPVGATREENKNIKNWLRSTLSVPKMINNKDVMARIRQKAVDKLDERINHEINYELKKLASKS